MRKTDGTIDWDRTEEYARSLNRYELQGAINDAVKTLPFADAMDREKVSDCHKHCVRCYHQSDGGYYRDCISVYRRVQHERATR